MKAPAFWQTGAFPAGLLAPLGNLTARLTARRVGRPGWRAPVPVICIGNATVGGTGKTPVAIDLACRLRARGVAVHVLTRGHGGSLRATMRVDPACHDVAWVGDEALLLAEAGPCWVGADRAASARAAVAAGASALLMDDGLQNSTLEKTCSLLVVDGGAGFGNGLLLPAGPLREPIASASARSRATVLVGQDEAGAAALLPAGMPILAASMVPGADMLALAGERVVAFAGIGRPGKFFATLRAAGLVLVAEHAFADHHCYRPRELARLRQQALARGTCLVTTRKDFLRLRPDERQGILPLDARLVWQDEAALEALLRTLMP